MCVVAATLACLAQKPIARQPARPCQGTSNKPLVSANLSSAVTSQRAASAVSTGGWRARCAASASRGAALSSSAEQSAAAAADLRLAAAICSSGADDEALGGGAAAAQRRTFGAARASSFEDRTRFILAEIGRAAAYRF